MTKRTLALTLVGLTAWLLPAVAHAAPPKEAPKHILLMDAPLSPADRRHLLQDTFIIVKTVREISAPVQKLLFSDADARDGMADPGAPYQTTDVVGPKPLPFRRLVLAANAAQYSLVYNEQGGFAYQQRIFLYRLAGGHARLVWEAWIAPAARLLDFDQLRSFIRDGKYRTLKQP